MTGSRRMYRPAGVVLARVSTDPGDLDLPGRLGLPGGSASRDESRNWLAKTWERLDVRAAVRLASPALAERIDVALAIQATEGRTGEDPAGRLVLALASYLLRWQGRPTPFGLFAGVTTAHAGRAASASFGAGHRLFARPGGTLLAALIGDLERHPGLLPRLTVVANSDGVIRGGRFVVPGASADGPGPGPLVEISVRRTRPVRAALVAAAAPVRFGTLAEQVAVAFPGAQPDAVHSLLASLVERRVLLTGLRPPTTVTDPLGYLREQLRSAGGDQLPGVAKVLAELDEISGEFRRHNNGASPAEAEAIRVRVTKRMDALAAGTGQVIAADTVVDGRITLPGAVLEEAAAAAAVLVRTTAQPFGSGAWTSYHVRFRERYGPGAVVPVRELVADSGLGFPAGFLGAARRRAARPLADRDAALLALIQEAAIDGRPEIELTEQTIATLTVGDPGQMVVPDRVELAFEVSARSAAELERGRFELRVTGAPRPCSSMAGRFAYLLPEQDRALLAASYRPADDPDGSGDAAVAAQLSFPPRRAHNDNVIRAPLMLPAVISLGEHPEPGHAGALIRVEDLAVTANATQFFLIHAVTGQRVIPRVLHALEASVHTPPLARFLAEVTLARHAVYGPFDFGVARTLPYLPRVRYRRTVLAPARWILSAAGLPPAGETMDAWEKALHAWQERWHAPDCLMLVQGELRLPLNLDQRPHRAVLRTRLNRAQKLELREAPGPSGRAWTGRACEFVLPLTASTTTATRLPRTDQAGRPAALMLPGSGEVIHARLLGHPARYPELLTGHLPRLLDMLGTGLARWWFRRYRDTTQPGSREHLSLYLRLTRSDAHGAASAALADFAADLHEQGLLADLELAAYQPQTGRYGADTAAAEQVAATDSASALAQITMSDQAGLPLQAITAASMTSLAAALAPAPRTGYQWLIEQLPRSGGRSDPALRDTAISLAEPGDAIRRLPGGREVATAWEARRTALITYRTGLTGSRGPGTVLRSLLHDLHLRNLGADPELELATGRLARAAALRRLALDHRPAT